MSNWIIFLTNLKKFAGQNLGINVAIALPKLTGTDVTHWEKFFNALRGVQGIDLGPS